MGVIGELELTDRPDIQIAIVGTKADTMHQPHHEHIYCYYDHYEVSAQANTGITEMFRDILGKYLEKRCAVFDDVALQPIQPLQPLQTIQCVDDTKSGQCCVIG